MSTEALEQKAVEIITNLEKLAGHWRQMLVLAVVSAVLGYWAGGLSS